MEPTYKDLLVALSEITPEKALNELQENPNHELKEQYEFIIKKDLWYAFYYASEVINGRWIEAESIIKKDPNSASNYAKYVIKGRWHEAEEYIKKDPESAYNYARDVIQGRFLEAEEYIKTGTNLFKYCKIIGERVPEKEHLLKGKTKVNYHIYFKIKLPAQDVNKEIVDCMIGKKSKYLKEIQNNKDNAIESIKNLISFGVIEESQVKELLEKIR